MWVCFNAIRCSIFIALTGTGVQSLVCKEANQVSSKFGAMIVLEGLLGRESSHVEEDILTELYTGPDTIVDAPPVAALEGIEVEES